MLQARVRTGVQIMSQSLEQSAEGSSSVKQSAQHKTPSTSPVVPLLTQPLFRASAIIAQVQLEKVREAYARLTQHLDSEALHDFRVGLRQLRSTFNAYPEAFPALGKKLNRQLRRLARDTNNARDSEVQLDWLRRIERNVGGDGRLGYRWLSRQLELRTAKAYRELRSEILDDFTYLDQQLRDVLARNEQLDATEDADATLGHLCGAQLNELVSEYTFHLRHIETREDEDQVHEARICGKRIRYLLAPLRGELKGCESVVRRLQRLQDLLGEYHDAQVFGDLLRKLGKRAAVEQSERWLELMLNNAPDNRALARERKQDNLTGLLLIARLVAKRKEKLFEQLGRLQAKGAHEQLLHDIAMLAARMQGHAGV